MMERDADLAALGIDSRGCARAIVGSAERCGRAVRRKKPVVMVPAEQDRLKEHGEDGDERHPPLPVRGRTPPMRPSAPDHRPIIE